LGARIAPTGRRAAGEMDTGIVTGPYGFLLFGWVIPLTLWKSVILFEI
jgi:hypothetical protein